MTERLTKEQVHYRRAHLPLIECGTCSMFQPPHSCTLVQGTIQPKGVCDRWEPKKNVKRTNQN